ncbi:MAG: 3-ketoacyl-ACP reductase [Bacteroidetes bacterium]|nr:3-ketoacyl-ACP reductase [Bacteroidota bacterium]
MAESLPVVLITGASRGLGRGIAQRVAELGCSIGIHYASNAAAAKETVDLCRKKQSRKEQRFVAIQADISSDEERRSLVKKMVQEFGRIDALVNNAGIGPKERKDITEMSELSFDEVLGTNLRGPHFLTQLVVKQWLKSKSKPLLPGGLAVVFISSVSAEMASIHRGEYCISKAGLSMVAKLWAARLSGEGITVFELRPGIMATDMTSAVKQKYDKMLGEGVVPQRRWGEPDDVGLAVKAILSGHFPFSSGSIINIDGGLTLPRL